tara:strand:+ start:47 stop:463 length:417 start_codon:yes stop_codon:yes gene_type:complete
MRWILQKQIINVLMKKLNNHLDLVHYILEFNKEDTQNIIDWYIEKDFYNWLNYDILTRYKLIFILPAYLDIIHSQKLNYYIDNYENLKLGKYKYRSPNGLRRTKSLTECFNSKWWKYTQKNCYEWSLIHCYINTMNYF